MEDTIVLPKILNINVVGELLKNIRTIISSANNITLDAKYLEEIDTPGLQLILSLDKTAAMNGFEFKLINAQDKLKKSLDMY